MVYLQKKDPVEGEKAQHLVPLLWIVLNVVVNCLRVVDSIDRGQAWNKLMTGCVAGGQGGQGAVAGRFVMRYGFPATAPKVQLMGSLSEMTYLILRDEGAQG